jgi:uncharacterized protein YndB with AHSA1/START domain
MSESTEFEHSGRVIRDEMRISASPETVYRAWADPDSISAWFVQRMQGRMEVGETVTWHWDRSGPGMSQRVLVADPPRRLVTAMDLPQGVSYLEVTIEQQGGHSILRLVQSGFGEGPEWDDQYEGMLSGWMMALGILKFFVERYFGRKRREIVVLADAPFDREEALSLQRTESGLARWLTRSGAPGEAMGEPVRLMLENGRVLTGVVLRNTSYETLWSWDEIEGTVEIKAFRSADWGSKVGIRISSWLEDAAELADLEGWLTTVVRKLAALLAEGAS